MTIIFRKIHIDQCRLLNNVGITYMCTFFIKYLLYEIK